MYQIEGKYRFHFSRIGSIALKIEFVRFCAMKNAIRSTALGD